MKPAKSKWLSVAIMVFGILLILGAAAALVYIQVSSDIGAKNAQQILVQAEVRIPTVIDLVPEERWNNTMPSMEIDGVNVVGILEIPKYSCKLPVHATWNTGLSGSMPCRYTGSIYDRTLIIGGSDREGQLDFAGQISIDDRIFLTDMEGGRYSYHVTAIHRSDSADTDELMSKDSDLTIFIKNSLSMEYIIIRCECV